MQDTKEQVPNADVVIDDCILIQAETCVFSRQLLMLEGLQHGGWWYGASLFFQRALSHSKAYLLLNLSDSQS
jgi:hypothetical protein